MEKYFKRKAPELDSSINPRNLCVEDINWEEEIKYDPGLRKQIFVVMMSQKTPTIKGISWNFMIA